MTDDTDNDPLRELLGITDPDTTAEERGAAIAWDCRWRHVASPAPDDDIAHAVSILAELWVERASIGISDGNVYISPRVEMTPDQERRLSRDRRHFLGCVPWFVPMNRINRTGPWMVGFDRVYPPAFFGSGWN